MSAATTPDNAMAQAEHVHPTTPIIGYSMPDNPAYFGEEPLCLPCWRAEGAPEGDPVHLGVPCMHAHCALCGKLLIASPRGA